MTQIKIAYRQIIDVNSKEAFEKNIFNDSFNEFYMQAQANNPENRFKTFYELVRHNPKANSLHYKVGFSIGLYIKEFNNIIPGIADSIGQPIEFAMHHFKIIYSDLSDKSAHKVAILYITSSLTLHAIAGEYLLLSKSSERKEIIESFTLKLQPNLSVIEWNSKADSALPLEYAVNKHNVN